MRRPFFVIPVSLLPFALRKRGQVRTSSLFPCLLIETAYGNCCSPSPLSKWSLTFPVLSLRVHCLFAGQNNSHPFLIAFNSIVTGGGVTSPWHIAFVCLSRRLPAAYFSPFYFPHGAF